MLPQWHGSVKVETRMKTQIAIYFIAITLIFTGARAQNDIKIETRSACPSIEELGPQHLYGLWRAEFAGLAQGATLLLERHPQWPDSFSGGANRAGVQTRVSGELESEDFSLEESVDGVDVSAVWQGTVLANSCGKEIRGTWNSATNRTLYPFVMRKLPG
jgi:hypothetical protein